MVVGERIDAGAATPVSFDACGKGIDDDRDGRIDED